MKLFKVKIVCKFWERLIFLDKTFYEGDVEYQVEFFQINI